MGLGINLGNRIDLYQQAARPEHGYFLTTISEYADGERREFGADRNMPRRGLSNTALRSIPAPGVL